MEGAVTDETRPLNTAIDRPSADLILGFQNLATTALGDVLDLSCVMRHTIHPLWRGLPRIAGPAFTARKRPMIAVSTVGEKSASLA
jgi:hypothetical protein